MTLRIDHDVLEFFRLQGKGYQTLINAILKIYVAAKQKNATADKSHKKRTVSTTGRHIEL